MDLNDIAIFVKVAETSSFSEAGRRLRMPSTTVSRRVQKLEAALETLLFVRTTRRVNLTEAGQLYYEKCRHIPDDAAAASEAIADIKAEPSGVLRVAASIAFAEYVLNPYLIEFMAAYPKVHVELITQNIAMNLIEQGIDVSFRVGDLPDSSLVATRVGMINYVVCASPTYLERHGEPTEPQGLHQQSCICLSIDGKQHPWLFKSPAGEERAELNSKADYNDIALATQAAIAGVGLVYLPQICVQNAIDRGQLKVVMKAWRTLERPVYVVYLSRRYLPGKLDVLLNFIVPKVRTSIGR